MEIIRFTSRKTQNSSRGSQLYELLEHVNTFSLFECRGKGSIILNNATNTVILDHFDEARGPSEILHQILETEKKIETLILVDSNPNAIIDIPNPFKCNIHIKDFEIAVNTLKNIGLGN